MVTYTKRYAFSMIELIFAIVIIAISVVSVPIMTNAIGEGVNNNVVQETMFAASAQINQALSYRWDENSINEAVDVNATGLAKVINSNGDCVDGLRPGHFAIKKHRMCLGNPATTVSGIGLDGNETTADDIDDLDGVSGNLYTGALSKDAYKIQYTYQIDVNSSTFDGNVAANNAKEVTVTVKEVDGDKNIITRLKAFTFNIGEIDYYREMHQ